MADSNFLKLFSGGHFSSEQLRQFAAESARIWAEFSGVRRTFGGVRWKFLLAEGRRIRVEPGRVRADSRESATEGFPPSIKPYFWATL